ncbi:nuclear transport factor 2 family protein [Cryptosporangium arvum]|uniref:nuclear transport factor 2 family protein n=1 Tax=Cryptosporangium arvum TaxID=80871 RepID=UPI0004BB8C05|nr:nuclear transport factor 2 family protein [Cryptosporangium arvum]
MPAADLFHRLLDGLSSDDWTALADLYAEDAHVTIPLALPEPTVLDGRAEIAAHFARMTSMPVRFTVANAVVHETVDPDVVIAEFVYDVHVTTTGARARVSNVQYLRSRDGLIAETHDYHDHTRLGRVLANSTS